MEELKHEEVKNSTFDLVVQSIAIILFIGLIIADKGLGMMKQPIPPLWYGIIGGFGVGGRELIVSVITAIISKK